MMSKESKVLEQIIGDHACSDETHACYIDLYNEICEIGATPDDAIRILKQAFESATEASEAYQNLFHNCFQRAMKMHRKRFPKSYVHKQYGAMLPDGAASISQLLDRLEELERR